MSVTLNGRSYTNASFTGYGYLGIFPEQFAEDLLAQAAIIAPDATTVSAKAAAATASAASRASRRSSRRWRSRSSEDPALPVRASPLVIERSEAA